jgi:hypothetical protein
MTEEDHMDKTKIQENQLLTPEERAACQEISMGGTPHSQRATALLALDEGATQIQAAEQAGLTKGQVRYWLGKFRQERLAIFPEELLTGPQTEQESEPHSTQGETLPASAQEVSPSSQPVAQTPASLESPTPAGSLEAEKEGNVEPVKRSKKAKKAKKGKKGSKKKAKKSQPAEDSQIKSRAGKKKKAKKKGGKKAKKGKKDKKSSGDKDKSKKKAKKKSKG